jgi:hypothetical protein
MEGKVKELKKKFHLTNIEDFMISAKIIGDDLFRYYLSNICNDGKICTLSEALKKIDMCEYHSENKDKRECRKDNHASLQEGIPFAQP